MPVDIVGYPVNESRANVGGGVFIGALPLDPRGALPRKQGNGRRPAPEDILPRERSNARAGRRRFARRGTAPGTPLDFHAWLIVAGECVIGGREVETYSVLAPPEATRRRADASASAARAIHKVPNLREKFRIFAKNSLNLAKF